MYGNNKVHYNKCSTPSDTKCFNLLIIPTPGCCRCCYNSMEVTRANNRSISIYKIASMMMFAFVIRKVQTTGKDRVVLCKKRYEEGKRTHY